MAIFASSSTITTQTVPLITVDLSEVKSNYVLQWDEEIGSFVAKSPLISPVVDLSDPSQIKGILPVSFGGTGNTEYQEGDLIVAKNENGVIVLDSVAAPEGAREKVLTSVDGLPIWINANYIKNITSNIVETFTSSGGNIGNILPENALLKKIKIIIEDEYTNTLLSIGTENNQEDILAQNDTRTNSQGIYIYEINKFYQTSTQLVAYLSGDNNGSLKIIIDYIAI